MGEQVGKVVEGWKGPGRRDGVIEPLSLREDGLYSDINKKGFYEWWYFDGHLDSGHTFMLFFHASNPNPGRMGKISIEFILIGPQGRRKQEFFVYDKSEFEAAHDWPEVRIGENTIKVHSSNGEPPFYEINVKEENLECHLKYSPLVNGWKPGTGISQFGELGFMGWVIPFARAKVEGTIKHGEQTIEISGTGYHDHNWLDFQFQRIIEYWMWGRIYSENHTLVYAYIQCNEAVDRHAVKVLMLARGPQVVLSTGEFDFSKGDFEYDPNAKHHFPRQMTINVPQELRAELNVKQVLEAQDMLDNFNPALRFIAKNFLRIQPGYFRLVSDFELDVIHGGESRQERGTTMHEIVIFKPLK